MDGLVGAAILRIVSKKRRGRPMYMEGCLSLNNVTNNSDSSISSCFSHFDSAKQSSSINSPCVAIKDVSTVECRCEYAHLNMEAAINTPLGFSVSGTCNWHYTNTIAMLHQKDTIHYTRDQHIQYDSNVFLNEAQASTILPLIKMSSE